MNVLSITRRLAGKHGRRRIPRSLQDLPTPNVHRGWGNMKDLSAAEKNEILHGSWRDRTPIQLVTDKTDRDGGGFTSPVAFRTDEEAQKFIAEEDREDSAEQQESTLALAQRFFVELATTADEELDAAAMPPAPQSDEERRREMQDVQRQFFADYYVEQRIISEAERYAFIDAMLRPSHALFLVNATLPLVRLTLRDQLEAHQHSGPPCSSDAAEEGSPVIDAVALSSSSTRAAPVFVPTELDACLYVIPLVPTQALGAPLYVPYTAATSLVGPPDNRAEVVAGSLEGTSSDVPVGKLASSSIDDADLLGAMLQDDFDAATTNDTKTETSAEIAESSTTDSILPTAAVAAAAASPEKEHRPPSLAHTYWLQRQVSSNALLNVDLLSHAVSLLSVRLAAATLSLHRNSTVPDQDYAVLVYQADTSATPAARLSASSTYHTEIAQYLYRATEEAKAEDGSAGSLARVVVVVEDATFTRAARSPTHRQRAALAPASLSESSDVPVSDRFPSVVYVTPSSHHDRQRSPSPASPAAATRSTASASQKQKRGNSSPSPRQPLRGRVVVCAPVTSQDGVRPRGWLSTGGEEEEDGSAAAGGLDLDKLSASEHASAITSVAAPNNFVQRCQLANENFTRLQRQLYRAICAVEDVDASEGSSGQGMEMQGGGWVVYATQSMNVMENEAVVCAVLQQLELEQTSGEASPEADTSLCVRCVPLTSTDMKDAVADAAAWDSLCALHNEGRAGLATWVAIEGGVAAQEAESYTPELRAAVAQASWRANPMRTGSDGGYLICLRVTRARRARLPIKGADAKVLQLSAAMEALTADNAARADRADGSASDVLWWRHPNNASINGVTPAAHRFLNRVCRAYSKEEELQHHRGVGYTFRVLHAGVPVGHASFTGTPSVAAVAAGSPICTEVMAAPSTELSSATSHADVLHALRSCLPLLQLSAVALSELLLTKSLSSRNARKLLRLYEKQFGESEQRSSDVREGTARADSQRIVVEREVRTFLASVEQLIASNEGVKSNVSALTQRRLHVLVEPAPESFTSATNTLLHPAVAAELHAACVVARLEFTPRPSHYDFTLLLDVPADMPERVKHLATLEEWRVALRDALCYVHRRTGAAPSLATTRLFPFVAPQRGDAVHMEAEGSHGGLSGVRTPTGTEEDVELAEDEYETTTGANTGSAHPQMQNPRTYAKRGVRAPSRPIDLFAESELSAAHTQGSDNDWLDNSNYREWRRRRSQR